MTITRGLSTQFLHARAGKWKDPSIKALDWRGKTLGILGLGKIGSQVADMATGLGFNVIYSNRHKAEGEPYEFVSREELFRRADVLLLLTPLTDETRGLINKKTIAQLKDEVIIVNVCEWSSGTDRWVTEVDDSSRTGSGRAGSGGCARKRER